MACRTELHYYYYYNYKRKQMAGNVILVVRTKSGLFSAMLLMKQCYFDMLKQSTAFNEPCI